MARPGQLLRPFIEAGPYAAEMLRQIESGTPDFVQQILAAFDTPTHKATPHPLLTQRELEVLRLLSDHLSEREIAERLTITLDTVKKHCYHIYNKLGVGKRRDAVSLARELGILP